MPFNIGTSAAKKVFFGTTEIKKIFSGITQIWSAEKFLFAAVDWDGTVKINVDGLDKKSTPTISGISDGTRYWIRSDDTHIYVAGSGYSYINKYLKSDLSYVSQIFISSAYGIDIDDTYIYIIGVNGNGNRLMKYLKSNMSYVSEAAAQGSNIKCDGDYIYFVDSSNYKFKKYAKSNLTYVGESSNTVYNTYGFDFDDTYVYLADGGNMVTKYLKSNLSYLGATPDSGSNIKGITTDNTHIYISSGPYVKKYLKSDLSYIGTSGYISNINAIGNTTDVIYVTDDYGYVYALKKTDLSKISQSGEHFGNYSTGILVDKDYVYYSTGTTRQVWGHPISYFDVKSVFYGDYYNPEDVAFDDTYVYTVGWNVGRIVKYLKSDLSYVGQSQTDGSYIIRLIIDGSYIYAIGASNTIRKYLKSDLSYIGEGIYTGQPNTLLQDSTHFFIGGSTTVKKVLKSTMALTNESSRYENAWLRSIDMDETYVYAVGEGDYSNSRIVKYLKSDLSYYLASSYLGVHTSAIVVDDTYAYVGYKESTVVKKFLKSTLVVSATSTYIYSNYVIRMYMKDDNLYVLRNNSGVKSFVLNKDDLSLKVALPLTGNVRAIMSE